MPAGIPMPESVTTIRIRPGPALSDRTAIEPPTGVNLIAFFSRFQKTC